MSLMDAFCKSCRYLPKYHYSSQSKKLANARGIEEVLLSSTGKYCFTFNKEDESFTQWGLDPLVMEEPAGENRALVEGRHVRDVWQCLECKVQ